MSAAIVVKGLKFFLFFPNCFFFFGGVVKCLYMSVITGEGGVEGEEF